MYDKFIKTSSGEKYYLAGDGKRMILLEENDLIDINFYNNE